MIKVGDCVTISPEHTIKFQKWVGIVVAIENDDLPIKVRFSEEGLVYGFDYSEVYTNES